MPPTKKPGRGGLWGALITAGIVGFKFIAPVLLFFKTAATMLLSVGAFVAMGWTWQVAAGLVVLIFVHEMGHYVAAKAFGLPVSAPMFIPFMGAYVKHGLPAKNWDNAIIAYAGPLAGGLGGWACYALGLAVDSPWLYTTAFYTFVLNLFNLAPIPPLDGSKIWTSFFPQWTPGMGLSDRLYLGLFLFALIAGLLFGSLECWLYWHPATQ